jgi:hypothetical protein
MFAIFSRPSPGSYCKPALDSAHLPRNLDGLDLAQEPSEVCMDDAEFDAMIARAKDPTLIAGIYNYCDRSCARCAFTSRCLSYLESRRELAEAGNGAGLSIPALVGRSLGRAFEMMQVIARREGIELSLTPEELAEAEREQAEQDRVLDADPLVALARRYWSTTWPIVQALGPIVAERGDAASIEAVSRVGELCGLIASKIYRAISGANEPEFDDADAQNDANGSAKVARLVISDSRAAWRVLMEVGRAAANGVPAALVRVLDELDASLAARFPHAMEFMRPGFDDATRRDDEVYNEPNGAGSPTSDGGRVLPHAPR